MSRTGASLRVISLITLVALVALMLVLPSTAHAQRVADRRAQKVIARPSDSSHWFGMSVAVWGDTAIVGGLRGYVYVYEHNAISGWVFRQKLTPSGGEPSFGYSVAVSGDTALVGAPLSGAGWAYVFTRDGGRWTERARVTPPDGESGDDFGTAVAVSGNVAVIGAPYDDNQRGSAHVYIRTGTTWLRLARLGAMDRALGDRFGSSVALDSAERNPVTVLVGAPCDDTSRGSAYVFRWTGDTFLQRAKIMAPDRATYDYFGRSVALHGGTAFIGAPFDNSSTGGAYVYTGSGSTWAYRAKLTAYDAQPGDKFGCSVAISGGAALIGAHGHIENRGAAYLYTGSGGTWVSRFRITATDRAADDNFGEYVALSGGSALIGARMDDNERGIDAGSAYLYCFRHALLDVGRIEGSDRYLTAAEASKRGFPAGAPAVVIATGANWPDALGGSALAGAVYGPLLLTQQGALPSRVAAEIRRLGAVRAYILGGNDVVSDVVESEVAAIVGRANVVRLQGRTRYETARAVADETIRLLGTRYQGYAFVATGQNFPDATAASPLAAYGCVPVLLADPASGRVSLPPDVTDAVVLGSEAAVPANVYRYLVGRLGSGHVERIGGANRYDTAAKVATYGLSAGAMIPNGPGIATGENFPDALAAGPMLATNGSVLLLTQSHALSAESRAWLTRHAGLIGSMFTMGGTDVVSPAVEAAAMRAAGFD